MGHGAAVSSRTSSENQCWFFQSGATNRTLCFCSLIQIELSSMWGRMIFRKSSQNSLRRISLNSLKQRYTCGIKGINFINNFNFSWGHRQLFKLDGLNLSKANICSRCWRRRNLRSLGERPHYIARCPAHSGGLSSHRLCSSAAAIGLIGVTAQTNGRAVPALFKKTGFNIKEKGIPPSVLRSSTKCIIDRELSILCTLICTTWQHMTLSS